MKKKALLISCFNWYEKRLKPIKQLLENDYEVVILTSDFMHIEKTEVVEKFDECTYIHVPKYKKNLSLKRIYSHIIFAQNVNKYLDSIKPELIYLLLPPNSTANYCLQYKKRNPQVKYIVDVIDLWPESMPIDFIKKIFIYKLWSNMRDTSLYYADHVFTECNLYQEIFINQGIKPNKMSTLRLFKEKTIEEREDVHKDILEYIKNKEHSENTCIKLGYLGSINYIIDINKICAIIEIFIKCGYKVELHIIGAGESKDELICQSEKYGAEVIYYGKIFDEKKKCEILGQCDFGLNIMKDTISVGLTIKSVDYFSMGIPIINTIKGDTWNLVEKEKIGINYNGNKNEFIEAIQKYDFLSRNHVVECFEKNFSKESFVSEITKYLKEEEE